MTHRAVTSIIFPIILSAAPICVGAEGVIGNSTSTTPVDASGKEWMAGEMAEMFRADATDGNPAASHYRHPFTITRLSAEGRLSDTGKTLPAEVGDGELTGSITARSYRRISDATTVWGHARFLAGKIKGVSWNNSADYPLVGPYVIGDPVGGDLARRSYDFSGGYAGRHDRWMWGVEAAYRAAIDYRGRDPRDKIVVSDLNLSAGGGFSPGDSGWGIGLSGRARVYNQSAAIEFYSPVNDIPTYAMTGLGSYYPRFSGNSGRNTAYSGAGFGATLSLFPIRRAGAQKSESTIARGEVRADYIRLRQFMRDFNNLELTHTATLSMGAEIGVLFGAVSPASPGFCYGFTLLAHLIDKRGTENLLGTGTGNSYPKIGQRDNYTSSDVCVTLQLPGEWRISGHDRLTAMLAGSYIHHSEKLTDPARRVSARSVTPRLEVGWAHRFANGALLTTDATISQRLTNPGNIILTGLDPDSELGRTVWRDIATITSDITSYGISAKVVLPLDGPAALVVKAAWQRDDMARRCGSADYLNLSVGVTL